MKTLLLLALLFTLPLAAREMTFAWDASAGADHYEIGIRTPGAGEDTPPGEWEITGKTEALEFSRDFPDAPFEIAIRGVKVLIRSDGEDAGKLVSGWSKTIIVPEKPSIPGSPRLRATIELQTSDNLHDWRPLAVITWEDTTPGKEFIRLSRPD